MCSALTLVVAAGYGPHGTIKQKQQESKALPSSMHCEQPKACAAGGKGGQTYENHKHTNAYLVGASIQHNKEGYAHFSRCCKCAAALIPVVAVGDGPPRPLKQQHQSQMCCPLACIVCSRRLVLLEGEGGLLTKTQTQQRTLGRCLHTA
jgi:hypothetical protein